MTPRNSISVEEYVAAVKETSSRARKKKGWLDIIASGLIGEFGSVVSTFKKHLLHQDEFRLTPYSIQKIEEELGDFLWYLVALSIHHKLDFGKDVLVGGLSKLPDRFQQGQTEETHIRLEYLDEQAKKIFKKELASKRSRIAKDFDTYQQVAARTQLSQDTVQMTKVCVSEISRFVGRLTRDTLTEETQTKLYKFGPVQRLSCIQDLMWSVSNIAEIQGLSLGALALRNVEKTREIYPKKEVRSKLTTEDNEFPAHEQFPEKFDIQIVDLGDSKSRMYWNGRPLGNDVNDNSYVMDGYRFHDVLHLTFVAHLGWSPVIRSFLQRKRKSHPEIDEIEDGARARLIDELVINMMHTEAERLRKARSQPGENPHLFPEDERFSSDFGSALRHLVRGLEVRDIKHWEWEKAAHLAFAIYEDLVGHREGTLTIDRKSRSIEFTSDLKLDLNGVVIRQAVDTREAGKNAGTEALVAATHAASCPDLKLKTVTSEIDIHEMGNGQYIAQFRGEARVNARQQNILSVKLTQSKTDQSIVTIATALGDPVDFS